MSRVVRAWSYRSYPCLIMHNDMGYLCGYVLLPVSHPLSGEDYDSLNNMGFCAHGGLTFASRVNTIDFEDISLINIAGGNQNYHMIGFDCAHAGDAPSPMYMDDTHRLLHNLFPFEEESGHCWTADEVSKEVEKLVDQLYDFDCA